MYHFSVVTTKCEQNPIMSRDLWLFDFRNLDRNNEVYNDLRSNCNGSAIKNESLSRRANTVVKARKKYYDLKQDFIWM